MCHYITATMGPNGDESIVRRLAKASLLKWEPLDNQGVIDQLRSGERYFRTARGSCDCGTEIGAAIRTESSPLSDLDLSRQIKKRKKQGWSDGKVDDWVEQTVAEAVRKQKETAARLAGPHYEVNHWIQFVSAVLMGNHADWIGIMLHWYRGNIATEALAVHNRRWLTLADFTAEYLLHAEEDVLHTVTLHS